MLDRSGARRGADANPNPPGNADKDPADWVSGDDPMTGAQASYLKTLCEETGRDDFRKDLSKAEASRLIDEIKSKRDEGL